MRCHLGHAVDIEASLAVDGQTIEDIHELVPAHHSALGCAHEQPFQLASIGLQHLLELVPLLLVDRIRAVEGFDDGLDDGSWVFVKVVGKDVLLVGVLDQVSCEQEGSIFGQKHIFL